MGSVEDSKKLWCDGKQQFKVQIRQLSQVRVFGLLLGKAHHYGETFGPPIKACILYCERLAIQIISESVGLLAHSQCIVRH